MEVSGTANGVSFSETDDWEQDEVIIRLKHSCRPLGGWNWGLYNEIYCPKQHLPKGDSIHLYTISNSHTSVLSNRIQEFGKAARPRKGEVTQNYQHLCGKWKKK